MNVKLTSSPNPLARDKAHIGRTVRVVSAGAEVTGRIKQWGPKLLCLEIDGKGSDWSNDEIEVFPIYVEVTEDAPLTSEEVAHMVGATKPKRAPRARKAPASS